MRKQRDRHAGGLPLKYEYDFLVSPPVSLVVLDNLRLFFYNVLGCCMQIILLCPELHYATQQGPFELNKDTALNQVLNHSFLL